jgi:hypothetical protein
MFEIHHGVLTWDSIRLYSVVRLIPASSGMRRSWCSIWMQCARVAGDDLECRVERENQRVDDQRIVVDDE